MYGFLKKVLFLLDAETSHNLTLNSLKILYHLHGQFLFPKIKATPISLMNLTFPNRVGLAAGLDKNADYIDALSMLGFGFVEIGTVTPKPQAGNPRPRLFRLAKEEAIINRMGFNSKGIDYVAKQLEKRRTHQILGINIGKNKETTNEEAVNDYVLGLRYLSQYADYMTVNVSSPNTQGLRDLQQQDALSALIAKLQEERKRISKQVPLVVKISPDMSEEELRDAATVFLKYKIDGVIATNTTLQRPGVASNEVGGLSGAPLNKLSTQNIRRLHELLRGEIPIIASGGVMSGESAREKMQAGASLVQVYTGLVYHGAKLVAEASS